MDKETVASLYNGTLISLKKEGNSGTSLVVQWLRIYLPMDGGMGSIPGWRTNIPHATRQLNLCTTTKIPQIPSAAAKIQNSQINK